MMLPLALEVAWDKLGQAVAVSVVIGLLMLLAAAGAVYASLSAADAKHEHHAAQTTEWSVMTIVCVGIMVAIIGAGIYVIAA